MTNSELKVVLQKMLDGDAANLDATTVVMLQDASIHAAQKLNLSLQNTSAGYTLLAAAHAFFTDLLGIDLSVLEVMDDPATAASLVDFLQDLRDEPKGGEKRAMSWQTQQVSEDERRRLDALLKDIKFDL